VLTLARAAALGDRQVAGGLEAVSADDQEAALLELVVESELARAALPERRESEGDRRAAGRPWGTGAPGRRTTDVLEDELVAAQRALREAEARLDEARAQAG